MPYADHKPWTRWWWFADALKHEDITFQLEWMREHGFGGAEVAWLGPSEGCTQKPHPFLSKRWADDVAFAAQEAHRLGLGLDFTFGSQWPFGGEWVEEEDAVQTWNGPSPYRLRDPWPGPEGEKGRVVSHLSAEAFQRYAEPIAEALKPALSASGGGLFCDSWEIPSNPPLWTEGFAERFEDEMGYDLKHLMNYLEYHAHARHDYRQVLSRYVVEAFYETFTEICHEQGSFSRAQCHGAPADLLAAYAAVDVPETETLLFDPHFASFAASAATLTGKTKVSCESFTALYGLSRSGPPGHESEQLADIKLVADAMFAHGVNQVFWHGMPYQGIGERKRFGATCHVGPDAGFASELPEFNAYMQKVSAALSEGQAWTDVAVLLPLEDQWMRHLLPEEAMRPSAHYHWEMQHVTFPEALRGYQPCWISQPFLLEARVEAGKLVHGSAEFETLWVDVQWLSRQTLARLVELAHDGASICLARSPQEPGYQRSEDYDELVESLAKLSVDTLAGMPLLEGESLPPFRARKTADGLTLFVAQPAAQEVAYPLRYGQSLVEKDRHVLATVNAFGEAIPLSLNFEPYQSLLLKISHAGHIESVDIHYQPSKPEVGESFERDHRYPGYYHA